MSNPSFFQSGIKEVVSQCLLSLQIMIMFLMTKFNICYISMEFIPSSFFPVMELKSGIYLEKYDRQESFFVTHFI